MDDRLNKSLEERLHNIYENHYSREVLDADWFKIVESVQEQVYVVRGGDTLWGISKVYFADGNYWSKLWSVNKNITNPHLILVGDTIRFTTGTFSKPPSITIDKQDGEGVEGAGSMVLSDAGAAADGSQESDLSSSTGGDEMGTTKVARSNSKGLSEANDLPDFFKLPFDVNRRQQQQFEIVPRPEITTGTDIVLTQEILSAKPTIVGTVKTVGGNRVVTGDSNLVVVDLTNQVPAEGTVLSIIDPDFEESDGAFVVKVLATIRMIRQVEGSHYEAAVLNQYDAMVSKSLVSTYVPSTVSLSVESAPKEIPVKVLDAGRKSIWTTGDFLFLKMTGESGAPGDILNFQNKFDNNVNSYLRSGLVKLVSTSGPFATGVVVYSTSALQHNSVSTPVKSEFKVW